ncbi:MAG: hypothetical protein Kow00124_25580 [Anaerolineae bacterium]
MLRVRQRLVDSGGQIKGGHPQWSRQGAAQPSALRIAIGHSITAVTGFRRASAAQFDDTAEAGRRSQRAADLALF